MMINTNKILLGGKYDFQNNFLRAERIEITYGVKFICIDTHHLQITYTI